MGAFCSCFGIRDEPEVVSPRRNWDRILTLWDKFTRDDEQSGDHARHGSKGNESIRLESEGRSSTHCFEFRSKLSYAEVACANGSSEDEDVCPTCLEEYDPENPKIVLRCSHGYHLSCIYEWMERSENCPICGKFTGDDEQSGDHARHGSKGNESIRLESEGRSSTHCFEFRSKLSYAEVACANGSSEDEDVCPTCLEEYDPENPKIVLRCSHGYHLSCIYEWMERSENCPICGKVMLFDEV
ncbi:hypothetical protein V6N13_115764 [Hibiscus sabdariffa]